MWWGVFDNLGKDLSLEALWEIASVETTLPYN
jgi:hypothetical protein